MPDPHLVLTPVDHDPWADSLKPVGLTAGLAGTAASVPDPTMSQVGGVIYKHMIEPTVNQAKGALDAALIPGDALAPLFGREPFAPVTQQRMESSASALTQMLTGVGLSSPANHSVGAFGGRLDSSLEDLLASSMSEPDRLPVRPPVSHVDPSAAEWNLYHGTDSAVPFENFDAHAPGTYSSPIEKGALFLSPSGEEASHYAGTVARGEGPAGPRVYPVTVDPGKTAVLDIIQMMNDPGFVSTLRANSSRYATGPTTAQDKGILGSLFDQKYQAWQSEAASVRAKEAAARAAGDYDGPAWPVDPPTSLGLQAGMVETARQMGLDTAVLRGLRESNGGDQVIVLNPSKVRPRYGKRPPTMSDPDVY